MITKESLLKLNLVVDNEWLDKYVKLINDNLNTARQKYKTQRHHIIPKYYYKKCKLETDNSGFNLINLLYKDHILVHYYLALCSYNDYYTYCNHNAIKYILSKRNIDINSLHDLNEFVASLDKMQYLYECSMRVNSSEERIIKISAKTKEAMQRPDVKEKLANRKGSNLGKHFSDTHRRRISESNKGNVPWNKGKKMTDEYCKIRSECQKGLKHNLTDEGKNSLKIACRNSHKLKDDYKPILCVDTGKIYEFSIDAAYDLFPERSRTQNKTVAQNISECCKNIRKSAYGYKWKFYEEKEEL